MQAPKISTLKTLFLPALNAKAGDSNQTQKLLIVLHGLGDSLDGYRFLPQELRLPALNYLLVNAPDAYFDGYSWYDLYGDSKSGIIRSRDKLFSLYKQLEEQGFLLSNTALFGFSQGCLMVVDSAIRYSKTFAAVVGISGYVGFLEEYPDKFSPLARSQNFLITHGTKDPMLPIDASRKQFQHLLDSGLNIDWREYEKVHTIDPVAEMEDIRRFLAKKLSLDLPR